MVKLRKRKTKDGRFSLYLDIYQDGTREYEYLRLYLTGNKQHNKETLALAEQIRAKRELEKQSAVHGFAPKFQRKADFFEYFEKITQTKAGSTRANYGNCLYHIKRYSEGKLTFEQITEDWLNGFKSYLLNNLSSSTAKFHLYRLSNALKNAVKDKVIAENPAQNLEPIKAKTKRIQYLTFSEIQSLAQADCPKPVVKRAFLFSCYTGLRYSDVLRLQWDNIQGSQINIHQQKTGETLYLPLNSTALEILGERQSGTGRVFEGLPSSARTNYQLRKWCIRAGLARELSFHVARHTFATLGLTSGVDIYTISKLLGHKKISTTEIYTQVMNSLKQTAVDSLPSVSIKK